MKKTLFVAALIASLGTATAADLHCVPAVDSAAFIVDVSGSMMQPLAQTEDKANDRKAGEQKILLARKVITQIVEQTQKEGSIRTSLFTVAPYTNQMPLQARTTREFAQGLEKLNPHLETFGRPTWVGTRAQKRFSESVGKVQAVILFTDGGFAKKVKDPVETIKSFYAANPDACIHFVSAARTEEEKAGIKALAGLKSCSQVIDLESASSNAQARQQFVAAVFPENCTPAAAPAPRAAVAIRGINFDFDKAVLTTEARKLLDHALSVIKTRPADEKIHIVGWTDYFGSDAYNAKLSSRRAQAVRAYLTKHGIASERIVDEGRGKSFRYSNENAHGQWQNRRVDLILGDGALISQDAQ